MDIDVVLRCPIGSSSRRAAAHTFYENVIESLSDEESDGETDLLMAAAGMMNEHFLMPPRRCDANSFWTSTQTDQNEPFVSSVCVGPLKIR
jgi:hypothetical protein